ncbi:MAG: hypothetical protein KGL02_04405 [Acidobacteriota bacterium]|nr:hypothetical protein [Acidobacteriota bacterium]
MAQALSQKTGLPQDKAQEAVNFVVDHLKQKLPASLSSGLDSFLSGNSGESGSLLDKAKSVASGLGGILGSKSE